jgi:ATP-binding cassette subfamily G (WHITE) protein 2 (PDR)
MAKETMTGLMRTSSCHSIKNEKGELINPFLSPSNSLLDPKSDKFSSKAWFKTIMSITSGDPEQYPRAVAGVAYKNLSAYGFGDATDYQKPFGNCPLKVLSWFKKLVSMRQRTSNQILRDYDDLVKSGEMLLVVGRPGR